MKRFQILRNEAGSDGGDGGGGAGGGGTGAPPTGDAGADAGGATNLLGDPGGQGAQTPGGATGDQTPGTPQGSDRGEGFSFGAFIGEDGNFAEGFTEALTKAHPELAEGVETLSRIKDPVSMAKALVHNKQLAGRKMEGIDAILNVAPDDEKGMALKREKLGIPQTADGYELKFPEKLADGTEVRQDLVGSDEQLQEFAEWAHKNDVPADLAQKLVEFDAERGTKAMANAEAEAQRRAEAQLVEDSATLKKELGSDYERSMDLLVRLLERGGMTREQIRGTQALRDFDVTRALISLASDSGDDRLPASSQQSGGLDAGAKAKDIINNPQNPLHKAYWSGDEDANAQVQTFLKQESAAKRNLQGAK